MIFRKKFIDTNRGVKLRENLVFFFFLLFEWRGISSSIYFDDGFQKVTFIGLLSVLKD